MRASALLTVAPILVLLLAACGAEAPDSPAPSPSPQRAPRAATLLLDFAPNAVHSGIYATTRRGDDLARGVRLRVRVPPSAADAVRLLLAGRADLAVLDIHDLALARERGRDVVGVLAIVQRPLAAVLAQPGIASPRDLEGRRVGVTGLPSDDAVLDSVVRGAGGDPRRVRRVTIGFGAVAALLARRVDAATAFWSVEGLALRRRASRPPREFRVDAFGAPAYPELVLSASRATLREDPELVRDTVAAVAAGYRTVLDDPAAGLAALRAGVPDLDGREAERQLEGLLPAFTLGGGPFGELDPARLRAWAAWEARFGIVDRPPDVARAFDPRFAPR